MHTHVRNIMVFGASPYTTNPNQQSGHRKPHHTNMGVVDCPHEYRYLVWSTLGGAQYPGICNVINCEYVGKVDVRVLRHIKNTNKPIVRNGVVISLCFIQYHCLLSF